MEQQTVDRSVAGRIDPQGAKVRVGTQLVPLVLRFPAPEPQPPRQAA